MKGLSIQDKDAFLTLQIKQVRDRKDRRVMCGGCNKLVELWRAYRCLYCGVWLDQQCMEKHLGQTREEYNREHHANEMVAR